MKQRISQTSARRLALQSQGLDGWKPPRGKAGALAAIERLGYVQIDSISVVERAHHHKLWSRCDDYAPNMLDEMLSTDRSVFEYWTHAMSYVPMCDYRFSLPRMKRAAQSERYRKWAANNKPIIDDVLRRIRTEGPLGAAHFQDNGKKRGPWWDWKPAKAALEWLFDTGQLMVTERRNFQRIFDLTERVLPRGIDTREPGEAELGRFLVRRTLGLLGLAPESELRWGHRRAPFITQALTELADAGEVQTVEVEDLTETFYALTKTLDARPRRRKPRVHILSPFDNLTIRRRWLKTLFHFEYTIECYTPPARRQYGYFCLPVLSGTDFIGRLDAKADRKSATLIVRNFAFEHAVQQSEPLLSALAPRLRAFATFNGCDCIQLEKTTPASWKSPIQRALA